MRDIEQVIPNANDNLAFIAAYRVENELICERIPIVAWHIYKMPEWATPVAEPVPIDDIDMFKAAFHAILNLKDGTVLRPASDHFNSIQDFEAAARRHFGIEAPKPARKFQSEINANLEEQLKVMLHPTLWQRFRLWLGSKLVSLGETVRRVGSQQPAERVIWIDADTNNVNARAEHDELFELSPEDLARLRLINGR